LRWRSLSECGRPSISSRSGPSRIRLLDGRSFLVSHPDFVALPPPPRKRDIVLYDQAGVHMIDLALIQEITLAVDQIGW